jgi:hypothetical protein
VARRWPGYRWYAFAAALIANLLAPVWAPLGSASEPAVLYAAVALLLVVAALAVLPGDEPLAPVAAGQAAQMPAGWVLVAAAPALTAVLVAPYGWLDAVWRGRPAGVGLSPYWPAEVAAADAVALAVVALAAALAVGRLAGVRRGRRAGLRAGGWTVGALLALPAVAGLAAAGAAWPAVPATALLLGLAAVLAAVLLTRVPSGARATGAVVGLALAGSGLAGSLPARGTTLAALGLALVAAAVTGAAGRAVEVRVAGWLSSVTAGLLLALASAEAAGLNRHWAAYALLAAAALALVPGVVLRSRGRPVEAVAVEAAAQAGAVTALLLTVGSARHAAALCTLWGVVLGLRALLAGSRWRRLALVTAAAVAELFAWWLIMMAERVTVIEAYTLPAAAVGLLAGWLAVRRRSDLSSWVAYGPALAAALLPSLGAVLTAEGQPLRRLLLGAGALAVVLAGSAWRMQAPVLLGGAVLAAVALHELVLVWDLLPRWIPLAVAGLLLVGLAMTLERRRRDLARVRDAVGRMT